jgi:hypothetical protein
MRKLQTKKFTKWAFRQGIDGRDLFNAIKEIQDGLCEAHLGAYLYKKRIAFGGQGKSSGGRTIVCYKKNSLVIFLHGFAKNEKSNLSSKELMVFKELTKILVELSPGEIDRAVENGDFVEVSL